MSTESVLKMVEAERRRQRDFLGYDAAHDDQHDRGELVQAAICYAANEPVYKKEDLPPGRIVFSDLWPWPLGRPPRGGSASVQVQRLTEAAALLVAEIERLQRIL
jgi:hypothetical protein